MQDPKAIVREGYDAISLAYRPEDFNYEGTVYQQFLTELDRHLPEGAGPGLRLPEGDSGHPPFLARKGATHELNDRRLMKASTTPCDTSARELPPLP